MCNQNEFLAQELWSEEKCLYMDSITFGNGKVVLLSITECGPYGHKDIQINIKGEITLCEAIKPPNDNLNEGLASLASTICPENNLKISVGECCSHGSNGFISVARLNDDYLIWLAFFTDSNPFSKVYIEGNKIVSTSTLGYIYELQIDKPESIKVRPVELDS